MKLWKISQTKNNGYDTYDSAVVVAERRGDAQRINPGQLYEWSDEKNCWMFIYTNGTKEPFQDYAWVDIKYVTVECLSDASVDLLPGVVCASFNAG